MPNPTGLHQRKRASLLSPESIKVIIFLEIAPGKLMISPILMISWRKLKKQLRQANKPRREYMKAIVFGGSGFLGSHVADALTAARYETTVFDVKKSPYLQKNQKMITGNILDRDAVSKAITGCDVVYNFAGMADIQEAHDKPLETVENNIIGNTVILEACRQHRVKRFVFASTVYVYSNAGSFYRSSKQACELIIENYSEVYGLDYTILRYGSLYGPRAGETNWVYKTLKQAVTEGKISRLGD